MKLHIERDAQQMSVKFAGWITDYIQEVLANQDRFTFVLSGGNTPKILFAELAKSPYKEAIKWEKIHFFWGDERYVPYEDLRNNARMCFEELLNKVPVKAEHIHIMRTDISPEESTEEYEAILRSYFGDAETTFDFVLNGMGDDGHTLSLFPGTAVIHETEKWVTSFFLSIQDMYRITLTAPVVNKAACVAFMAVGENKAKVLKEVLEGESNVDLYPSQIIKPEKGELHWFVDEAAASLLTK
ncbi:6-phosphogluconolactonase [Dyadobacter arcticus]|uniref:6-phosphogluconolactonase n=1 Tax=Dyadobacter arcticus TaxID=1078754 RepID=A0ABX0UGV2_9BACT|nr:6-phosphogluconolactonase [Dyadobacter arcticus]NIJ52137.1 6-phosphogluconolactonase [Dyadobacter arcticus]